LIKCEFEFDINNVLILHYDELLVKEKIDMIKSKMIDVGFFSSNTVNITHLSIDDDNKIDLNIFFQRGFVNINGKKIYNQEINDNYTVDIKDIDINVYPVLTTTKVYLDLI